MRVRYFFKCVIEVQHFMYLNQICFSAIMFAAYDWSSTFYVFKYKSFTVQPVLASDWSSTFYVFKSEKMIDKAGQLVIEVQHFMYLNHVPDIRDERRTDWSSTFYVFKYYLKIYQN